MNLVANKSAEIPRNPKPMALLDILIKSFPFKNRLLE
jgi:hypothetical protein